MYHSNYDEAVWRNASEAAEREEIRREARDMADWYAGESPEYVAWLHETTPDAPRGAYEPRPRRIDAKRETTARNEEVA